MANDAKFENTVAALFQGMNGFIASKTVVGDTVHVGDTTIIPLIDVSFGMAAGASSLDRTNRGSGGMGGKMTPCAVLVIRNGSVKLVNVKNQDAITKILDMVPDVVDKVAPGKKKGKRIDPEVEDAINQAVEKDTKKF